MDLSDFPASYNWHEISDLSIYQSIYLSILVFSNLSIYLSINWNR